MTARTTLLWNLLLALTWAFGTGSFTLGNLTLGFVLGYLILLFLPHITPSSYFAKLRHLVSFLAFFTWELLRASLRVAYDVVTPRLRSRPAIVAVPLDVTSDEEIALLATLVTLTPGSMSLEISPDRRVLYVHGMFVDDPEVFRRSIKEGFERRIMEFFR
jgi:multicomponent Na+:H+ antiporter subunit E